MPSNLNDQLSKFKALKYGVNDPYSQEDQDVENDLQNEESYPSEQDMINQREAMFSMPTDVPDIQENYDPLPELPGAKPKKESNQPEVDPSEFDMGDELMEATPATPEKIDGLQAARDAQLSQLRNLAIAQAGQQIGQALAGKYSGDFKADTTGIDNLKNLSKVEYENAVAKDKEQGQKAAAELYRGIIKEKYPNMEISSDVPVEYLKDLIKNFQKASRAYQQSDYMTKSGNPVTYDPTNNMYLDTITGKPVADGEVIRNYVKTVTDPLTGEIKEIRPGMGVVGTLAGKGSTKAVDKKEDGMANPQFTYVKLNPKERESINEIRKEFASETKDQRDSLQKLKGLSDLQVDEATGNQIAASQLGAQVATIYENGRLTDEDVLRYTRRQGIVSRLSDAAQMLASGTIPPDKAKEIKDALRTYQKALNMSLRQRAEEKAGSALNVVRPEANVKQQDLAPFIYSNYAPVQMPSEKVLVQLPDGTKGRIDKNAVKQFKKDHPDAKVLE